MIRAGGSRNGQSTPSVSAEAGSAAPADSAGAEATDSAEAAGTSTVGSDATVAADQPGQATGGARAAFQRAMAHNWVRHLALLAMFEIAGIAATWPRLTFLGDGTLPATQDVSSYVWYLWWVAHQLAHPGNPFFTTSMAAPVGVQLGFNTLMPLAGWVTAPITLLYGPSASFTLLALITPGLLCYVMYRAARLWMNAPAAIVAGAFFGLSSMLMWQNWYHLNIAMGTVFLPLTVEAAVRFRREPRRRPAVALGLALGASILINQESTIVALVLAAGILIPWIVRKLIKDRASLPKVGVPLLLGAGAALVVASPELIAMWQQVASGGAKVPASQLALNQAQFGVPLPTMFAPSPRLAHFGLGGLASAYSYNYPLQLHEAVPTFGATLTALALLGLVVGWRKRTTWWFGALWISAALVALGTSLTVGSNCNFSRLRPGSQYGPSCRQYLPFLSHLRTTHVIPFHGAPYWAPVRVSDLMPYTWLIRIPGLGGLREADRFAIAGLVGAALLAGLTVQWLSQRRVTMPLIAVVIALGVLESGWSATGGPTMPTALPRLTQVLSHDPTSSIVVDVPFGERGGVAAIGSVIAPNALVIATGDGHPRAISYTSWVTIPTKQGILAHPFYWNLISVQDGGSPSPAQIRRIIADLKTLHVGWVVEWRNIWLKHHPGERYAHVDKYLRDVGFRRVRVACLVPVQSIRNCPSNPDQQVWLYKYEPGHA